MRVFILTVLFLFSGAVSAQHPVTFATKQDFISLKNNLAKYSLLQKSFNGLKQEVDPWLGKEVDVPVPKDPAGGYTHDRHKSNYQLLFNSGLLYNITGDIRYAILSKNIFLKYAALNPTLQKHPQATSSSPGRIFWQALNDANWLVYAGLGYDLIYNSLSPAERKTIETGAFKPEVDFVTGDLKSWFNLIHNHGVWACAGVGIVGLASGNEEYVQMALKGTGKDGNGGFFAQLNNLFSPDGYYTEGPYYVRYALLPFYLFANALNNARPQLSLFQYRNQVLKKALLGGLQQTNTDGTFFPFNDALKEKDYTTNEMITAVDIAWSVYGPDNNLLAVAQRQNRVILHKGGMAIAAKAAGLKAKQEFQYSSIEFADGTNGNEGGVSYLRAGKGNDLTTLGFKYSAHGLSHGHFDKLNFFLYDKGNEIFTDYGSVRFINLEQKWGGRYLPENNAYAIQTIAHNTITVDESSQFGGKESEGEKYHSEKLFSDITHPAIQVVSAREDNAYKKCSLIRTLYLLQLPPSGKRVVVDLYTVTSSQPHQYDLPFQYSGQLISTTFKYKPFTTVQETLGKKNGYQFLWKEAEASLEDTMAQFTFLNGRSYYSVSSLIQDSARIFLTRTGASDPNFNLRREPAYIIRKTGNTQNFFNVIEIHGTFDPVNEYSSSSYPSVQHMQWIKDEDELMVAEVMMDNKKLLLFQVKKAFNAAATHRATINGKNFRWTGPFLVLYNDQDIKTIQ